MKRILIATLGTLAFFALADAARAQQFMQSMGGAARQGSLSSTGPTSSLFSNVMTRPDFRTSMSFRPIAPASTNFMSVMPSFPRFNDLMLGRNLFGPIGLIPILPKQAPPPPKN